MLNFRLIASAILLIAIALYWGLDLNLDSKNSTAKKTESGQSFSAQKSHTLVFNKAGQISQELKSERSTHYPKQKLTKLEQPQIKLYQEQHLTTVINAQRGEVTQSGDKVDLFSQVDIVNHALNGTKSQIQTEHLQLNPNNKTAKTLLPVQILSEGLQYQAVGMQANFTTDKIDLLSNIKGLHEYE